MSLLIKANSPRSLIPKPLTVYSVVKTAGKGAYGEVFEVISQNDGKRYVCKTVKEIFRNKWTGMSILRELIFGRVLNHPNILHINEVLLPKDMNSFQGLNIIYEKMDFDLMNLIRNGYPDNMHDAKIIMKQILLGVKYLHSVGIIHRDLKLDNILINYCDLSVKICDFGLSCLNDPNHTLTKHVVTRYYRCPEILLENEYYDESADMWSLGCIFTEILIKRILINGKSDIHQLYKIIEVVGKPSDLSLITNNESRRGVECINMNNTPKLNEITQPFGEDFSDLISGLLNWNLKQRYTADECLNHRFFKEVENECVVDNIYTDNIKKVDFQFDERTLSESEILKEVINEIYYYHPQN